MPTELSPFHTEYNLHYLLETETDPKIRGILTNALENIKNTKNTINTLNTGKQGQRCKTIIGKPNTYGGKSRKKLKKSKKSKKRRSRRSKK